MDGFLGVRFIHCGWQWSIVCILILFCLGCDVSVLSGSCASIAILVGVVASCIACIAIFASRLDSVIDVRCTHV